VSSTSLDSAWWSTGPFPLKKITPPESTKSRNSNFSLQIQIESKSQVEFVPRDTEESEFLDLVDFGGVAFSVETFVITGRFS